MKCEYPACKEDGLVVLMLTRTSFCQYHAASLLMGVLTSQQIKHILKCYHWVEEVGQ